MVRGHPRSLKIAPFDRALQQFIVQSLRVRLLITGKIDHSLLVLVADAYTSLIKKPQVKFIHRIIALS